MENEVSGMVQKIEKKLKVEDTEATKQNE